MANFARLHDDMLEYGIQLTRILENLEAARQRLVTRRDTRVRVEATDLAWELRDVAAEYGDWLQDTAEKSRE